MAPEVIIGERYTQACDVYSFSLVLFEIASRSLPFLITASGKPAPSASMPYLITEKNLRPLLPDDKPEAFPEKLRQIIQMSWVRDPEERPSMSEVINCICKWREDDEAAK